MVGASKVAFAVVPGFMAKAQETNVIVPGMAVSNHQAVSGDVLFEKSFQAVLFGVRDDLEAEPPGIPLNGTNDNGLATESLLAKIGFVYLNNAG